ncbi:hypothetical protein GOP47_0024519 [Adiantum capillus-veneris]|uniref:Serine hydrolase domain-containing protein n=1 Tax=Adiantum capillus-veneris TaxID=13818 RepID=A0A9D4Z3R5_ADICA|nr:hypothetical protein GOP47_0024519 [Adiantum capillus-veneris]
MELFSATRNGAPSRKPLRVLCLHGFRTSAAFLQQQLLNKWDKSLLDELLVLTFLDAPFPCKGKSDVEGIFPPPFYEWFQYNIIFTEFTGLEECIWYISNYMFEHGPFDGLLGFSQGAVLCAALVGLQQKGLALLKHPPLRFVLVISGAMFKNIKVKEDCYSDIIRCPSVHFIGSKDWLKPKNEELRQVFEEPIIVRHGAKHTIPRLDKEAIGVLRDFLRSVQTSKDRHLEGTDNASEYREATNEGVLQEQHRLEVTDNSIEFRGAKREGLPHEDCLLQIEVAA